MRAKHKCPFCEVELEKEPFTLAKGPKDKWYKPMHLGCWRRTLLLTYDDVKLKEVEKRSGIVSPFHPGELRWSGIMMQGGVVIVLLGLALLLFWNDANETKMYFVPLLTSLFWLFYVMALVTTRSRFERKYMAK